MEIGGIKLKEKPLVSIITPSYNQGEFIEDTILSIKNQDYSNIEHIIIDGGSTDNTLKILKKYKSIYNMQWISETDEGQAHAINKGIKMAKGSILTWLNSDDYYLHEQAISKVVYFFELYKSVHVVTGNGYYVDEERRFLSPIVIKKDLIYLKYMKFGDFILQPSTFFKREIEEKVSIDKNYTYVFDWLFFLNIFEEKFNVLAVDDFLSAYRVHDKHKTGEDNAKRKKEVAKIIKRNFGIFKLQTFYCYIIYWLYSFSEFLPNPIGRNLKNLVKRINAIMSKLTFYRIYSC
jgi:glycosyltransferase involved in cell wall biosynthesis